MIYFVLYDLDLNMFFFPFLFAKAGWLSGPARLFFVVSDVITILWRMRWTTVMTDTLIFPSLLSARVFVSLNVWPVVLSWQLMWKKEFTILSLSLCGMFTNFKLYFRRLKKSLVRIFKKIADIFAFFPGYNSSWTRDVLLDHFLLYRHLQLHWQPRGQSWEVRK